MRAEIWLAELSKKPLGEMGSEYWAYVGAAFLVVLGGFWLGSRLWAKGQKAMAVLLIAAEVAAAVMILFFAEGLRQPEEIEDPGIPEIELDLPAELPTDLPDEQPAEPATEA
ncbi:MAG: hypothetical protein ACQKBY_08645 [Verrucomicrobiales bacterium]